MYKLLIVDDDIMVLNDVKFFFEQYQYTIVCAQNASKALSIVSTMTLDCIILDIDLPDCNGFDLFTSIRHKTCCPLIFLSGHSEEHSRIKGLSIGGDDYVCKPFSLIELELRVKARIGAKNSIHLARALEFGSLLISPINRIVCYDGISIEFSTQEFDLLFFLASHPHTVFTYEQIHEQVWKIPIVKGVKSVQMTIVRIRRKLLSISPNHDYLQTIRNKGYLFVP